MQLAEAVGRWLAGQGVEHVFGVVGSGNFHVTNALVAGGARFVAAAHENGAACMADAYTRIRGRPSVVSVHQGPGVTNALTGITEAAKSRTPLLVLAPEATQPASNFYLDLPALATSIGAAYQRATTMDDVVAAWRVLTGGRTVMLGLPLAAQSSAIEPAALPPPWVAAVAATEPPDVTDLAAALTAAQRPLFIAGRGATGSRDALVALAEECGALLATSAAAKGLFAGVAWNLDVSGGFATPLAAELIGQADLVVAWGSTLNMWTTRHGRLISPDATVAQVDRSSEALGRNRTVHIGVCGEVSATASACVGQLGPRSDSWRTPELRARIAAAGRWRDVSYVDDSDGEHIDPRTLNLALDDLLPRERTVVVDSGNFMGYPSMFLDVPDVAGFCFTQAFQSIGLGLANGIGAAIARPDRLTVAALGDGGFLMGAAELSTAVRLGVPLLVVVHNDAAYGAEVHHFGPDGYSLDTVRFPDTDLAAVARGYGGAGITVRDKADLAPLAQWLADPRGLFVVDAKVASARGSWWLEEAFRGH
jgi:acetolactate synthase-1/2/3 large subunit